MTILRGGRPVVNLSIMLNYQLNGMNVVGYHIFNIATHILNSIMVYFLVLGTLTLPQFLDRYQGKAKWMALFCALLFGVHPIQTESVTYIISRSELLATFFYLAAFLLLIRGARSRNFLYAIGVMIASVLAVSSKEWAVTLPALLVLYDFLFLAEGKVKQVLSRWYYYVLAALTWILVIQKLNLFATGGTAGVGFNIVSTTGVTAKSYLYTSFNVIWTYIRLLFLPINQNLDYDYPIAKTLFELPTILSLAGHLMIIAAAVWLYRTKKWTLIPFGVAWFYIGLSPVQSFVPVVDVIFEHRLYMPSIGFFLFFIVLYESVFDWIEKRKAAATA
ncbi:MAG: hypothetical protein HGB21_06710 [Nitrospirae bacterium]|nr:hypothetical protein [Nitrospirota bacterium]